MVSSAVAQVCNGAGLGLDQVIAMYGGRNGHLIAAAGHELKRAIWAVASCMATRSGAKST